MLYANSLDNVANVRRINAVRLRGQPVRPRWPARQVGGAVEREGDDVGGSISVERAAQAAAGPLALLAIGVVAGRALP